MSSYYENIDVVLVVYDITNYPTFENIEEWLEGVRQKLRQSAPYTVSHILYYVIGNKADIDNEKINRKTGHWR